MHIKIIWFDYEQKISGLLRTKKVDSSIKSTMKCKLNLLCGRHLEVYKPSWAFSGEIWTHLIVLKIAVLDVTLNN